MANSAAIFHRIAPGVGRSIGTYTMLYILPGIFHTESATTSYTFSITTTLVFVIRRYARSLRPFFLRVIVKFDGNRSHQHCDYEHQMEDRGTHADYAYSFSNRKHRRPPHFYDPRGVIQDEGILRFEINRVTNLSRSYVVCFPSGNLRRPSPPPRRVERSSSAVAAELPNEL